MTGLWGGIASRADPKTEGRTRDRCQMEPSRAWGLGFISGCCTSSGIKERESWKRISGWPVELEIFQLKRFLQENPHLLKLEISVGKCKPSENSLGGIR